MTASVTRLENETEHSSSIENRDRESVNRPCRSPLRMSILTCVFGSTINGRTLPEEMHFRSGC